MGHAYQRFIGKSFILQYLLGDLFYVRMGKVILSDGAFQLLLVHFLKDFAQFFSSVVYFAFQRRTIWVHQHVKEELLHDEDLILGQEITLLLVMQETLNLSHIGSNDEDGGDELDCFELALSVLNQDLSRGSVLLLGVGGHRLDFLRCSGHRLF